MSGVSTKSSICGVCGNVMLSVDEAFTCIDCQNRKQTMIPCPVCKEVYPANMISLQWATKGGKCGKCVENQRSHKPKRMPTKNSSRVQNNLSKINKELTKRISELEERVTKLESLS